MRKILCLAVVLAALTGCTGKDEEIARAIGLRTELLTASCSFDAQITADYGEEIYSFSVSCQGDSQGNLTFTVVQPESIAGITGVIANDTGRLTFDDAALTFPLLADGQVTPVSAPWLLLKTLRGGYLTAAGMEGELLRLTIDDSYDEDALQLDIWLDGEDCPVQADILYDGRRILAMEVENFQIS